jgi:hypothetical protein
LLSVVRNPDPDHQPCEACASEQHREVSAGSFHQQILALRFCRCHWADVPTLGWTGTSARCFDRTRRSNRLLNGDRPDGTRTGA